MSKFGSVSSHTDFVVIPLPPNDTEKFLRGDNTWGTPSGGGGALASLSDVVLDDVKDGEALAYSAASGKWVNALVIALGGPF